jgi:hypothetical protein
MLETIVKSCNNFTSNQQETMTYTGFIGSPETLCILTKKIKNINTLCIPH